MPICFITKLFFLCVKTYINKWRWKTKSQSCHLSRLLRLTVTFLKAASLPTLKKLKTVINITSIISISQLWVVREMKPRTTRNLGFGSCWEIQDASSLYCMCIGEDMIVMKVGKESWQFTSNQDEGTHLKNTPGTAQPAQQVSHHNNSSPALRLAGTHAAPAGV